MLTERVVRDAKATGKNFIIWDGQVKGLGLQVTRIGTRTYILRYPDATGRKRQIVLGRAGEVPLKDVRRRAGEELFAIRNGGADPAAQRRELRDAPTVADLIDRFFAETVPARTEAGRMSPKTVENYASQARVYVLPMLGKRKAGTVMRADVEQFAGKIKALATRNRVLQFLSRLFTEAERWDWRPERSNPVRLVVRAVERPRTRVLAATELAALAAALDGLEGCAPYSVNAIRVAAMTGLRIGEVLGMRWDRVNLELGRASLETKTGPRTLPLSAAVVGLLADLPRVKGCPWVFAGAKDGSAVGYKKVRAVFAGAAKDAGLADVRLHDLRRTLATTLASRGINAYLLRDVLGHRTLAMSNRYVQAAGEALADAVEQGAAITTAAMGIKKIT